MPIIKSAIKQMHQTAKRRERNLIFKQNLKDSIKTFRAQPTAKSLAKAQSALDMAVKKNLIKKGTAARRMAQLSAVAKTAKVKLEVAKKKATTTKTTPKKPAPKKKSVAKSKRKSPAKK